MWPKTEACIFRLQTEKQKGCSCGFNYVKGSNALDFNETKASSKTFSMLRGNILKAYHEMLHRIPFLLNSLPAVRLHLKYFDLKAAKY